MLATYNILGLVGKVHTLNLAVVDSLDNGLRGLAVDLAADRVSSSQNLLDTTLQVLGEGLVAHGAGNLDDLINGDGLVVLDVLLLLAVTRGLLEGLDDERRGSGDNRDRSLTVLDGQLDGDTETFLSMVSVRQKSSFLFHSSCTHPVTGSLGDIFTDLLGGETKRTDLRSKGRRGTNLTTGGTEVAIS